MKNISVIICNNGLGHTKRVLSVLCRLLEREQNALCVSLFVNSKKLKMLSYITSKLNKPGVRFDHYNVESVGAEYEKEFINKFRKKLEVADFVWSDNQVFPLKYRTDTFLTGSFLWFDVFPDTEHSLQEKTLLEEIHPEMIASKYFATPGVRKFTNFKAVGIYEYFSIKLETKKQKSILVSCGTSASGNSFFSHSLKALRSYIKDLSEEVRVYIEPEFYDKFQACKNVVRATFSEQMFKEISAAVIRPGVGTICDVLVKGGRIFSYKDGTNFEIEHNADVLEQLNVGETKNNIVDSLRDAVDYVFSSELCELHLKCLNKLEFDGVTKTAYEIEKIINGNRS